MSIYSQLFGFLGLTDKKAGDKNNSIFNSHTNESDLYKDKYQVRTDDNGVVFLCDEHGYKVPGQTEIILRNGIENINIAIVCLQVGISNEKPLNRKEVHHVHS